MNVFICFKIPLHAIYIPNYSRSRVVNYNNSPESYYNSLYLFMDTVSISSILIVSAIYARKRSCRTFNSVRKDVNFIISSRTYQNIGKFLVNYWHSARKLNICNTPFNNQMEKERLARKTIKYIRMVKHLNPTCKILKRFGTAENP